MSDHAWFRLVVRAIGVLLLGLSVPMLVWDIGALIVQLGNSGGADAGATMLYHVPTMAGYGAQAAIGLYLLMGGDALVRYCLKGVRGRCSGCGYDITATTTGRCPECGMAVPPAADQGAAR